MKSQFQSAKGKPILFSVDLILDYVAEEANRQKDTHLKENLKPPL